MTIRISYAGGQRWRLRFGQGFRRSRLCRRLYVDVPTVYRCGTRGGIAQVDGVLSWQGSQAHISRSRPQAKSLMKMRSAHRMNTAILLFVLAVCSSGCMASLQPLVALKGGGATVRVQRVRPLLVCDEFDVPMNWTNGTSSSMHLKTCSWK